MSLRSSADNVLSKSRPSISNIGIEKLAGTDESSPGYKKPSGNGYPNKDDKILITDKNVKENGDIRITD